MAFKFNVLVVANRTAGSDELLEALRARAARGSVAFRLLIPSTRTGPQGRQEATDTMRSAVARLRDAGLEVDGAVGDADPMRAVADHWDPHRFDEVIVSTLPGAASKWLLIDLPHRIARHTGVQVTHVLAQERRPHVTTPVPPHDSQGVLSALSVLSWGGSPRRS